MAKNGLECAQLVLSNPKPKNGPYLGLRGSKPNSEGTESTCNPPLFVVSQPQICPTRHLDPRTSGHLVEPEDSPARARWGPMVDPQGSPGRKKSFFSQSCCQTTWPCLGDGKSQNALNMGCFGTKKWVKNGSKTHFPKSDWTTWDAQTSVFSPFRARGDAFWLLKNPKMPLKGAALEAKLGEKWVTNRSKATSNKQATLLLSVLAITPFHGFGLYSTLAISYPRWCPCQIQVLSHFVPQNIHRWRPGAGAPKKPGGCPPKLAHFFVCPNETPAFLAQNKGPETHFNGAPGQGRQAGRALPNSRILCPKPAFLAQNGPETHSKPKMPAKRTPIGATLHVRLNWPVTNSPFLSSNSTICPRAGPKMAKNGLECAQLVLSNPKPKNGPYLGLRGSKPNSEGTESTCNLPLFVVSQPQICPTRHLDPRTSGHLVEPEDSPARARWGPMVGPQGSPGRKKSFFPKLLPDHLGCSNKCF